MKFLSIINSLKQFRSRFFVSAKIQFETVGERITKYCADVIRRKTVHIIALILGYKLKRRNIRKYSNILNIERIRQQYRK